MYEYCSLKPLFVENSFNDCFGDWWKGDPKNNFISKVELEAGPEGCQCEDRSAISGSFDGQSLLDNLTSNLTDGEEQLNIFSAAESFSIEEEEEMRQVKSTELVQVPSHKIFKKQRVKDKVYVYILFKQ